MKMQGLFLIALTLSSANALAASYRTDNFVVSAQSATVAKAIGQKAESCRRELAVEWLGKELPNWPAQCPIRVFDNPKYGAGGSTSFRFQQSRPTDWRMIIHGPLDKLLDTIVPHEVAHTVFASHFGCRLPRWASEGACTTVEQPEEQKKFRRLLAKIVHTGRRIPLRELVILREDPSDVAPLYAQGHALASYLLMQGGKQRFVRYLREGLEAEASLGENRQPEEIANNWARLTKKYYGYESLSELEAVWISWIQRGLPSRIVDEPGTTVLASDHATAPVQADGLTETSSAM